MCLGGELWVGRPVGFRIGLECKYVARFSCRVCGVAVSNHFGGHPYFVYLLLRRSTPSNFMGRLNPPPLHVGGLPRYRNSSFRFAHSLYFATGRGGIVNPSFNFHPGVAYLFNFLPFGLLPFAIVSGGLRKGQT